MLEKFKREMKRSIGNDVDNIEWMEDNLLVISDSVAAIRIERNISRLSIVDYAYYHDKKGGIVFSLNNK